MRFVDRSAAPFAPLALRRARKAVALPALLLALGAGPASAEVTFARDVAPIFQKSCQNCHRPGSIAPMSLLTYEDARPWARSIKQRVEARQMRPWHVDRTVGIRQFKDDPSLTDREIETLSACAAAGAPRVNPADLPPPPQFDDADRWHIGKPALIVPQPKGFTAESER